VGVPESNRKQLNSRRDLKADFWLSARKHSAESNADRFARDLLVWQDDEPTLAVWRGYSSAWRLALRSSFTLADSLKVGVVRQAEIAVENGALVLRPIKRP
jgi:hypothetical protein